MNGRVYAIVLHAFIVLLAGQSLFLAHQNRELRAAMAPPPPSLEVGQTVPPLTVQSLEGVERALAPADPARDRLLLVFTTTCQACARNQTAWQALHEAIVDDAEVVGISLDDRSATATYQQARALPFDVMMPVERAALTDALGVTRVPLTVHLDADGRVRGVWSGVLSEKAQSEIRASFPSVGELAAS